MELIYTTQTPDNTPTVETLRMISQKLSHLGLSADEGSLAAISYFKALLSLKAQELAFQGHVALCILFMLGVIATTLLFRRKSDN